jgi:hypothetical protein
MHNVIQKLGNMQQQMRNIFKERTASQLGKLLVLQT